MQVIKHFCIDHDCSSLRAANMSSKLMIIKKLLEGTRKIVEKYYSDPQKLVLQNLSMLKCVDKKRH